MKTSLAATAALVGLAVVAVPSHAAPAKKAPKPQIVDVKGDATDAQSAHDLLSVQFTKTFRGKAPKGFTVKLTLAAPPSELHGITYVISGEASRCGTFTINYSPQTGLGGRDQTTMPCGEPSEFTGDPYTIISGAPVVKGNTVTFTYSRKGLPDELRKGDTLTDLQARVDYNEPVFGIIGPGEFGVPLQADAASGTASFAF